MWVKVAFRFHQSGSEVVRSRVEVWVLQGRSRLSSKEQFLIPQP